MTESKIEWTDRSDWNPIRGCTRVSPGCGGPGPHGGCYAEAMAGRFSDPGQWGHGFAERVGRRARWTGKVEFQWDRLELPLRWRKAAKIFATSTSDPFHEALGLGTIAQLFGVMIAAHHLHGHTLQVLTKRSGRMRALLNDPEFWELANCEADMQVMSRVDPLDRRIDDARATLRDYGRAHPPPGIWLGVSVEDQQRANERIPDLLATPAAVRWLSCEPLLGPIDLARVEGAIDQVGERPLFDALHGMVTFGSVAEVGGISGSTPHIDWVVTGGESGPDARDNDCEVNMRLLQRQCTAAGIAFFGKQNFKKRPLPADLQVREFPRPAA